MTWELWLEKYYGIVTKGLDQGIWRPDGRREFAGASTTSSPGPSPRRFSKEEKALGTRLGASINKSLTANVIYKMDKG